MSRSLPLEETVSPVGSQKDRENGRYLYIGPPDLILQIRMLTRKIKHLEAENGELKRQVHGMAEKQPGADNSADPDSAVLTSGIGVKGKRSGSDD